MPCCSVATVAAHSVSPRLFVSGCTIQSPPVRLIRHSSEGAAGPQIFHLMLPHRSRAEEFAEKRVERCTFNLPWPPSSPQAKQPHIPSMLSAQYAAAGPPFSSDNINLWTVHEYATQNMPIKSLRSRLGRFFAFTSRQRPCQPNVEPSWRL